jgi:cyclic pyranopterin phosphate synthase
MAERLSHLDDKGETRMVDVSRKAVTEREAAASAFVRMGSQTLELVRGGGLPKGDVLAAARLAGIMAAKRTPELIPLCHPLPLENVTVEFRFEEDGLAIETRTKASAKTGVEMEALTAAAVAALTVYDMCKSADRAIEIGPIRLERKSGGASGTFERKA